MKSDNAERIKNGDMTIEQVPEVVRVEVQEALDETTSS